MNNKFKVILLFILAVAVVASGVFVVSESRKDYIDGNVLYLPATINSNEVLKTTAITLPWINNSIAHHLLFRTLFLADSTLLNMEPDLAAKPAEVINNGESYKVTLKSGQKWVDGTEITVEDVIFSIESVQKVRRGNNYYKAAFSKIDSIEAHGNEITLHMKERTTMIRPMLAQLVILPKKHLENEDIENLENAQFWTNPITSGMYKIDKTTDTGNMELIKSDTYTGSAKPKIEKVILEESTRSIRSDYYFSNNVSELMHYRALRGYLEFPIDMLFYRYFVFNIEGVDGNKNPAMQDIRVRQAISMAIDRKGLLDSVYMNAGNITDGAGTVDEFGPYDYNPEEAKRLLAESDYDLKRPLRFAYYYSDVTSLNFLKHVKAQLDEIGFNTELVRQSGGVALYQERQYDVLLKGLASFQASEWFEEYSSRHAFLPNVFGGKGEFDKLINEVIAENDSTKHAQLIKELSKLENEMLFKFPLFTLGQSVYINVDRVILPKNHKFGNYFYIYDIDFENWEIRKK